jgi:hypothetical protein
MPRRAAVADPHPRGSLDTKKKAKRVQHAPPPPIRRGEKARNIKTDISVPPAYIDAMRTVSKRDGITLFEWHRLAVFSYAKQLVAHPIHPRPTKCDACQRPFTAPRAQGKFRRQRVTVNFDQDTIDMMNWIASNYYHGIWSQAFEAAVHFFLGRDAPPPEEGAR